MINCLLGPPSLTVREQGEDDGRAGEPPNRYSFTPDQYRADNNGERDQPNYQPNRHLDSAVYMKDNPRYGDGDNQRSSSQNQSDLRRPAKLGPHNRGKTAVNRGAQRGVSAWAR